MSLPFHLSPLDFLLLALAAFLIGGAKTGLSGIGILAVPIFASVFDPFTSAGLLLPVLIVADVTAVIAWRRHGDQRRLWPLVPWVLAGTAICSYVLWQAHQENSPLAFLDRHLRPMLGILILVMLALSIWKKGVEDWLREHPHAAPATGFVAGVATTMNAAGPVMNLYLLAQKLPKEAFVGTGVWFFLVLNCAKVPILGVATGTLKLDTLELTLLLTPAVLLGCWLGFLLVKRIPEKGFNVAVRALVFLAGVKLVCS
ncbi:MAG: hypothetical protein RL095_2080 [Verrucomicrobiota bacterium]|jgi:uncharacterized membrane protein YfcA